jgi:hypothetical protein
MTLTNGTRVEFALNIPYVGTKKGAGIVIGDAGLVAPGGHLRHRPCSAG